MGRDALVLDKQTAGLDAKSPGKMPSPISNARLSAVALAIAVVIAVACSFVLSVPDELTDGDWVAAPFAASSPSSPR